MGWVEDMRVVLGMGIVLVLMMINRGLWWWD